MTLNVRLSGILEDHVAENVGEYGAYENVSEYVRDLIRKDRARAEEERFQALKAELQAAFATPDSEFLPFDADEFRARMKKRYA
ncbi:addiction module antitoxin [Sphingomonas gilva]|uniref:Addiction module antitoxin n=1 Tax=Sphingomonas gilva TaxID=2305907 RepID=A0A396RN41_9SPHN|nr:addiction module antitoxin [Sphingomonas gilva]RHW17887.1 addiction module antitoxin [Sphingomonas gilva]